MKNSHFDAIIIGRAGGRCLAPYIIGKRRLASV